MSFAVDKSLNRCLTDVCERVILMSRLRHCSTNTLDDSFTTLATTVTERGFCIEYPWSRQAAEKMRDTMRARAAASTALLAETGNEPQREERHDNLHRLLVRARWAIIVHCRDLLHAKDHLAMRMGQQVTTDLMKYRPLGGGDDARTASPNALLDG